MDFWNYAFAVAGAFAGGFAVSFYVYHQNKVKRDFDALVAKVKAEIQNGQTPSA